MQAQGIRDNPSIGWHHLSEGRGEILVQYPPSDEWPSRTFMHNMKLLCAKEFRFRPRKLEPHHMGFSVFAKSDTSGGMLLNGIKYL